MAAHPERARCVTVLPAQPRRANADGMDSAPIPSISVKHSYVNGQTGSCRTAQATIFVCLLSCVHQRQASHTGPATMIEVVMSQPVVPG